MKTTYPKAEQIANKMPLPVTYDKDTFELYGYKIWVLDERAATSVLTQNEIYCTSEAFSVAMSILEQRVSRLN